MKKRKIVHQDLEKLIQSRLIKFLRARGWTVERMVGNMYQSGIPDLYIFKKEYGERWIDVKVEGKYSFTKAQKKKWPDWEKAGIGIWILTGHTQVDYDKLFNPPNWRDYWKASWGDLVDIDKMIEELNETDS